MVVFFYTNTYFNRKYITLLKWRNFYRGGCFIKSKIEIQVNLGDHKGKKPLE